MRGHRETGPRWNGPWAALATCAASAVLLLALSPHRAAAQTVWEMSPYRVTAVLALAQQPGLTASLEEDLRRELALKAEAFVGAVWDFNAVRPPAELRAAMLSSLGELAPDQVPESLRGEDGVDKLLLLAVRTSTSGYAIEARELDVATASLGALVHMQAAQRGALAAAVFDAALTVFSPLAIVEASLDNETVVLRLRGGGLPVRDPSLNLAGDRAVFRPVIRYSDREGRLVRALPVPWTFLLAQSIDGALVKCKLVTGLRNPLSSRRRGRVDPYALVVRDPRTAGELRLVSRTDVARPLAGYAVYAYGTDSQKTELLGLTDQNGALRVEPGSSTVRVLVVKNGGHYLAKLPFVPGLQVQETAAIPDDDERLGAEGFVVGMQESLVDLVARRLVLVHRIETYLDQGRYDEAEALIEKLRRLESQQQFTQRMRQQRDRITTTDPVVSRQIDALFSDTQAVIAEFLDPREISRLERLAAERQSKAPSGARDTGG